MDHNKSKVYNKIYTRTYKYIKKSEIQEKINDREMGNVCGIWITISKEVNTSGSKKTEMHMYVYMCIMNYVNLKCQYKWSYVQHFGTFHD